MIPLRDHRYIGIERTWTIKVSLSSIPFILAHVADDLTGGFAEHVGLDSSVAGFLFGMFLAAQVVGLLLIEHGEPGGFRVTSVVGLVWLIGVLVHDVPELVVGAKGAVPSVWVIGLLLTQAATVLLAYRGWKRW